MSSALRRGRAAALLGVIVLVTGLPVSTSAAAGPTGSLVAVGGAEMTPRIADDLSTLPAKTPYAAFVHFGGGSPADHRTLLEDHGLNIAAEFPSVAVAYAAGTVGDFRVLSHDPSIVHLEDNRRLAYRGDTGPWASRARVAQKEVSGGPYRTGPGGEILDGDGVGVAIVDSGIDGTHPDLRDRIGRNFKIVCTTPLLINTQTEQCFGPIVFQEAPTTDTTSGHGTHVSGITAGDGTQSGGTGDGTYTGVAPGSTLYGYSTGEVIAVLYAAEAFQHILDNNDSFTPRIKVVNNSWGDDPAPGGHNPNSVLSKLTRELIDEGVTMMFAAGNSGCGSDACGSAVRTSSMCQDPTPGVVCVANYNDAGTGNRNNVLSTSSSRGRAGFPNTYPDISAPGSSITAACVEALVLCATGPTLGWAPWYSTISGTSMASPHVAGSAALLYQAVPDITPAAVENVFLDTAHKFTAGGAYEFDPQNPDGTTSFDKGAGLLDVPAALDALGVTRDGAASPGAPEVHITDPADQETFGGTAPIPVAGTAFDGTAASEVPREQLITDGDGGDVERFGVTDLVSLSALEEETGITYNIGVRDFSDRPSALNVSLRVTQNLDGNQFLSNVVVAPDGTVTPSGTGPGAPESASVDLETNTVSMFVPFSSLGDPPAGAPGHNVFASSFIGAIVDVAPGGPGADVVARPRHGDPYTVLRPQATTPPAAEVTLQVDDGAEAPALVTGTSPSYEWSTMVDASGLAEGAHTLTARLYLDGVEAATSSITIFIEREQEFTHAVAITTPEDGSEVPRATVEVRGTSSSDAPPESTRAVTLQVTDDATGGATHDSGELAADGTNPWSVDVDFGALDAGAYDLTARLYVGSDHVATDAVTVTVPEAVEGDQVSCAPRGMGFWRQQFGDSNSSRFTTAEVETLASHAVELSDGYFSDRDDLVDALFASGRLGIEERAARSYAVLLLNLAAGDLSESMSAQVGLSGAERLDPDVYDTNEVGDTVDAAALWMRARFDDKRELGGVNEVATAINEGVGLIC